MQSANLSAPKGQQRTGRVDCPTGKVPLGGGVVVSSNALGANVNTTAPDQGGWVVSVNNATTSATTFRRRGLVLGVGRRERQLDVPPGARLGGRREQRQHDGLLAPAVRGVREGPKRYEQVVVDGTQRPRAQDSLLAICPAKTTVSGGGLRSGTSALEANVNSTFPTSTIAWCGFENNGTFDAPGLSVFAVCVGS